ALLGRWSFRGQHRRPPAPFPAAGRCRGLSRVPGVRGTWQDRSCSHVVITSPRRHEGVPPVPGENLSRDEAQERAALLSVDGYEVSLDLRSAVGDPGDEPRTFRSVTTVRFRCAEPGAATFADLIAPSV